VLSTSNRFARAIDRSRLLVDRVSERDVLRSSHRQEVPEVFRRVLLIGRALVCFYLAAACFALATLGSISAAVLGQQLGGTLPSAATVAAAIVGMIGFCAFIVGAGTLAAESRTAIRSLSRECDEAIALAAQKDI